MLTGDKLETALCIARSLQLGGGAGWRAARECAARSDARALLRELAAAGDHPDLVIEGETLEVRLAPINVAVPWDNSWGDSIHTYHMQHHQATYRLWHYCF